jgi:hypothetical protein
VPSLPWRFRSSKACDRGRAVRLCSAHTNRAGLSGCGESPDVQPIPSAAGGDRTHDLRIKSPLLCQLSYGGHAVSSSRNGRAAVPRQRRSGPGTSQRTRSDPTSGRSRSGRGATSRATAARARAGRFRPPVAHDDLPRSHSAPPAPHAAPHPPARHAAPHPPPPPTPRCTPRPPTPPPHAAPHPPPGPPRRAAPAAGPPRPLRAERGDRLTPRTRLPRPRPASSGRSARRPRASSSAGGARRTHRRGRGRSRRSG